MYFRASVLRDYLINKVISHFSISYPSRASLPGVSLGCLSGISVTMYPCPLRYHNLNPPAGLRLGRAGAAWAATRPLNAQTGVNLSERGGRSGMNGATGGFRFFFFFWERRKRTQKEKGGRGEWAAVTSHLNKFCLIFYYYRDGCIRVITFQPLDPSHPSPSLFFPFRSLPPFFLTSYPDISHHAACALGSYRCSAMRKKEKKTFNARGRPPSRGEWGGAENWETPVFIQFVLIGPIRVRNVSWRWDGGMGRGAARLTDRRI